MWSLTNLPVPARGKSKEEIDAFLAAANKAITENPANEEAAILSGIVAMKVARRESGTLTYNTNINSGDASPHVLVPTHNDPSVSGSLRVMARGNKEIELHLYGDVGPSFWGGVGASDIADALKGKKDHDVTMRINSPGGDVFEGLAIYNLLKSHSGQVNIVIDSLCASIATIISLAGDTVEMATEGYYMIHAPWTFAIGSAADLSEVIDRLESMHGQMVSIYERHTGLAKDEIDFMMREETWMDPQQAMDLGFVTSVVEHETRAAAMFTEMSNRWFAKRPNHDSMACAKQRLEEMDQRVQSF